jgi:hypothetical protein
MGTRDNLAELRQRFEKIRKEILAGRSRSEQVQSRLDLMAYLHSLADEMALGLESLGDLDGVDRSKPTPPWLKADRPIAVLRAYRVELVRIFEKALPKAEAAEELAQLRERLAREPEPGFEIIDTCKLLTWFTRLYLLAQTKVEAEAVTRLPFEGAKDEVDETVRARMPEAARDQTLARLKQFARHGGDLETHTLDSERKDIARRRTKIDKVVATNGALFREVAIDTIEGVLRHLPDNCDEAKALREHLEQLTDENDPIARQAIKRWLTVLSVLQ